MPDNEKLTDEVRAALEAQALGLPPEVIAQQAAVAAEWSTWVATRDITYGGALAYHEGDPVPAANVKQHSYDLLGWVTKRTNAPTEDPAGPADGTVKQVLARVGDDQAAAASALEAELAKGDQARSSLIEKLQPIVANVEVN